MQPDNEETRPGHGGGSSTGTTGVDLTVPGIDLGKPLSEDQRRQLDALDDAGQLTLEQKLRFLQGYDTLLAELPEAHYGGKPDLVVKNILGLLAQHGIELPRRPWRQTWWVSSENLEHARQIVWNEYSGTAIPWTVFEQKIVQHLLPQHIYVGSEYYDELRREARRKTVDDEIWVMTQERAIFHQADRDARRAIDAQEAEAARGPRLKRTARAYAQVPRPAVIMDQVLAAEVNLLGGPSEAGKSLLARDWVMAVAAGVPWHEHTVREPRACLWIASEGTHDFDTRWETHPLWDRAADNIYVLDETVNLLMPSDVQWLLEEYDGEQPGLVVFDVIYGMGLPDDNGTKDVGPLIAAMKKISAAWGAATLALGHPGHNLDDRRFRGSSMWRQLAYTEWHMARGRLTCEKSKLADKAKLGKTYVAEYPAIRWTGAGEVLANASQENARRMAIIQQDLVAYPDDNDSRRARRLADVLGIGDRQVKRLVKEVRGDVLET